MAGMAEADEVRVIVICISAPSGICCCSTVVALLVCCRRRRRVLLYVHVRGIDHELHALHSWFANSVGISEDQVHTRPIRRKRLQLGTRTEGLAAALIAYPTRKRATEVRRIILGWCTRSVRGGERVLCEDWPGDRWQVRPQLLCAPSEPQLIEMLEAEAATDAGAIIDVPMAAADASRRAWSDKGSREALLLADRRKDGPADDDESTGVTAGGSSAGQARRKHAEESVPAATPAEAWAWHRDADSTAGAPKTLRPPNVAATPAEHWAWHRGSPASPGLVATPAEQWPWHREPGTAMVVTDLDGVPEPEAEDDSNQQQVK